MFAVRWGPTATPRSCPPGQDTGGRAGRIPAAGLAPVIFCLVLLAIGSTTLVIELLSLLSAALVLIVGVILIGLWAMSCFLSTRWRYISFGICAGLVAVNAIFGLATWIVMIVERGSLHDPLDSRSPLFGRERIIFAGFACWVLVLLVQVCPSYNGTDRRLHLLLFSRFIQPEQNSTHQHKYVPQYYHLPYKVAQTR